MSGDIFKRISFTKNIFRTMGTFLSAMKLIVPQALIKKPIPDGRYDFQTGKLLPQKLDGTLYDYQDVYSYGFNIPFEIPKEPIEGQIYVVGDYSYTFNGSRWVNEPLLPNQDPNDPGMYVVGVMALSGEKAIAGLRVDGAMIWNPATIGDDLYTQRLDGGEF